MLVLNIRWNYICTIVWFVYFIVHGHIANDFHVFNTYQHEDKRWPRFAQRKQVGLEFFVLRYGMLRK